MPHQVGRKVFNYGGLLMLLTAVRADPVALERELRDLEQLRHRVVGSLVSGLQGPRQRHLLRVKLSELNRSIANIRLTLSEAAFGTFYSIAGSDDCSNSALM